MISLYKLIFVSSLIVTLNISSAVIADTDGQATASNITFGYSALKLFLEDEQHLTSIRRIKMVITLSGLSDDSSTLIDAIADSSEQALDELEKLAKAKPHIVFDDFSDDTIAKATFNSLRMTTAKEFLFDPDNFEKNLLLSQLNVLPVISHLAEQLDKKETNTTRKTWLIKLADRYEKYYQQVKTRISISTKKKS